MPLKRNSNLIPLSRSHHYGLLFCWKIDRGINQGIALSKIQNFISYFWAKFLQPHMQIEEEFIFGTLDDGLVNEALQQHEAIKQLYGKITEHEPESGMISEFSNLINRHIRYEERVLFPHIEKQLKEVELSRLGEVLSSANFYVGQEVFENSFWGAAG